MANNDEEKICPICKKHYFGYPAISRRDNKTEICSECGAEEAFQDMAKAISKAGNKMNEGVNYGSTKMGF